MNKMILLFLLITATIHPVNAQDDDTKLILEDAQNFIEDGYFENGISQLDYYTELTKTATTLQMEVLYIDSWVGLENYMEAQRHIDVFLKKATASDEGFEKITHISQGIEEEIRNLKKQLQDWASTATKDGEPYNWDAHNGLLPVGFAPGFKWCGYIDKEGNAKTPFIYSVASHFENGIAYVDNRISGYKELIDSKGDVVTKLSSNIKSVYPFQEGYAGVLLEGLSIDKKPIYGIINNKGERIDRSAALGFEQKYIFSDGARYPKLKDGKFGSVSVTTGESFVDEDKYVIFYQFFDGTMLVRPKNFRLNEAQASVTLSTDFLNKVKETMTGLYGYAMLDQNGKEFIPMDDTYVYLSPFINGYSVAAIKGKGYGVINKNLEAVIPFEHAYLGRTDNPEEFVTFEDGDIRGKANVYNIIMGKMLPKFVQTTSKRAEFPELTITYPEFSHKYMALVIKKGKVRFYDHDLNEVFDKDFVFAKNFTEGMAVVWDRDGKAGYINEDGKLVIDYIYSVAQKFNQGLAAVGTGAAGSEKFGFINIKGEVVIPLEYDYVEPFFESTEIFKNYYSILKLIQSRKIDINSDPFDITFNTNEVFFHLLEGKKLALVKKKDKLQFIDQKGKVWLERIWNELDIKEFK